MTAEYRKIPLSIIKSLRDLSPAALKLTLCLSVFFNDDGVAFPSLETIEKMTGLSRWRIQDARRELSKHGLKTERRGSAATRYIWQDFADISRSKNAPSNDDKRKFEGANLPRLREQKCSVSIYEHNYITKQEKKRDTRSADFLTPQDQTKKIKELIRQGLENTETEREQK